MLLAYDQAAWHGTDAFMALHPDLTALNTMLAAGQADGRWRVDFGFLNSAADSFFVHYQAFEQQRPDSFVARRLAYPASESGVQLRAARALRTAKTSFGDVQIPYNTYVLQRADSTFWVYFLPAQTDAAAFPHGADARYLVSADGRHLIDSLRMHHALLNLALPDSAVSGMHTVISDDVPQDSDVFLVLARRPLRPELVVTQHYLYQVCIDGSITWQRRDSLPR